MNKLGFTLIELMIVVAIIGILAVVAVPTYSKYVDEAAKSESNTNLMDIMAKQESYFRTWNKYDTACQTEFASNAHTGKALQTCQLSRLGFEPGGATYWTYGTVAKEVTCGDIKDTTGYVACAARIVDGVTEYAFVQSCNKRAVIYGATNPCE